MWFKVNDNLWAHRKVRAAGFAAMGLWVRGGALTSAYGNDGHLSTNDVTDLLGGRRREIDSLVAVGLWVPMPDGWVMHDFLDFNPSAAEVELERARSRGSSQRYRDRRRG